MPSSDTFHLFIIASWRAWRIQFVRVHQFPIKLYRCLIGFGLKWGAEFIGWGREYAFLSAVFSRDSTVRWLLSFHPIEDIELGFKVDFIFIWRNQRAGKLWKLSLFTEINRKKTTLIRKMLLMLTHFCDDRKKEWKWENKYLSPMSL